MPPCVSLSHQCIVNIGDHGSELIRSRVVQAGTLDVVGWSPGSRARALPSAQTPVPWACPEKLVSNVQCASRSKQMCAHHQAAELVCVLERRHDIQHDI